jgi:hypothetical protein
MTAARIDWPKLLGDIAYMLGEPAPGQNPELKVPVSQERLAEALGVSRGSLRNWIDGSEPRHADGEQLLVRWCSLSGKARTFAPVHQPVRHVAARWERTKAERRTRPAEIEDDGPSLDHVWRARPRAVLA